MVNEEYLKKILDYDYETKQPKEAVKEPPVEETKDV